MSQSPFIYNKYVTGKNFLGRKQDVSILKNLLAQYENITIFSAPKTGKMSLIQQALFEMKTNRSSFVVAEIDMMDVRDIKTFATRTGDAVIKAYASTQSEFTEIIQNLLPGTHFVFDSKEYSSHGSILSLNWDIDSDDIKSLLVLPFNLSRYKETHIIVVFKEFQNIHFLDNYERILKSLESVIKDQRSMLEQPLCSLVMVGSQINLMKDIFIHHGYLRRLSNIFTPSSIDEREIIEYGVKGFLTEGKVIDRETLKGVFSLFRGNVWYINHFFAICDHLSKGYIMEPVLMEALNMLISIHSPRFEATMNDLTTFQVSLLRAITDGYTKFSSAEVISKYALNSSANVKRLKDALSKKEILTFDDNDDPIIIDPLFEYWVKKYFFHKSL